MSNKENILFNEKTTSLSDNDLIVIAVKDSFVKINHSIKDEITAPLDKIKHISSRNSYIAIIESGKVVFEDLSDNKIEKKYIDYKGNQIEIVSAGFSVGNCASIKINGVEFSNNFRGLNVVTLNEDQVSSQSIDGFDNFSKTSIVKKKLSFSKITFDMIEEINRTPIKDRVFLFWQSKEDIPGYIKLLFKTFMKFNPTKKVFIINYDNCQEVLSDLGLDPLWFKLQKLTFPIQSDILLNAAVYKYGGIGLDLDTLVTGKLSFLDSISNETFFGVGNTNTKTIHLALLGSYSVKHPLLNEFFKLQKMTLQNWSGENYKWNFLGNGLLDSITQFYSESPIMSKYIKIIDNKTVLLEIHYNNELSLPYGSALYQKFYFNKEIFSLENILKNAPYNLIFLHNSWTPEEYKMMTEKVFLEQDILLSNVLKNILSNTEIDQTLEYNFIASNDTIV